MSAASAPRREALVEDERGRACPAVVRFGPHVFISGADGHRRLDDERIDAELAGDAIRQCSNAYGRIARRLERAGYSGECAVRVDNYTSGQEWRLQRMGLWPEFFGEENHQKVVSFGVQSRLHAINMLTAVAIAVDPAVPRTTAVAPPGRGRASRITRVGELVFVIGVRGHHNVNTGEVAPEETDASFDIQFDNCIDAIEAHMKKDGTPIGRLARVDGAVRGARFVPQYEAGLRRRFGGKMPFGGYAAGFPLGARGEQEISGIAVAPGHARAEIWSEHDATRADAVVGGGLAFLRSTSAAWNERTAQPAGVGTQDLQAQVRQAVDNLGYLAERAGSATENLLRLDIFLRDIYAEDEVVAHLGRILGKHAPVVNIVGAEPRGDALLEVVGIAGAA